MPRNASKLAVALKEKKYLLPEGTKYFMLVSLYCTQFSYACYARAYVRIERYA